MTTRLATVTAIVAGLLGTCGGPGPDMADAREMLVLDTTCIVDRGVATAADLPFEEPVNVAPLRYEVNEYGRPELFVGPLELPYDVEVWVEGGPHKLVPPTAVAPCDERRRTLRLCDDATVAFAREEASIEEGDVVDIAVAMSAEDATVGRHHTWLRGDPPALVRSEAPLESCGPPAPPLQEMDVLGEVCVIDRELADARGLPFGRSVNVQPLQYRISVWEGRSYGDLEQHEVRFLLVPERLGHEIEAWTGRDRVRVPSTAVAPCAEEERWVELCEPAIMIDEEGPRWLDKGESVNVGVPMRAPDLLMPYHTRVRSTPPSVLQSERPLGEC